MNLNICSIRDPAQLNSPVVAVVVADVSRVRAGRGLGSQSERIDLVAPARGGNTKPSLCSPGEMLDLVLEWLEGPKAIQRQATRPRTRGSPSRTFLKVGSCLSKLSCFPEKQLSRSQLSAPVGLWMANQRPRNRNKQPLSWRVT